MQIQHSNTAAATLITAAKTNEDIITKKFIRNQQQDSTEKLKAQAVITLPQPYLQQQYQELREEVSLHYSACLIIINIQLECMEIKKKELQKEIQVLSQQHDQVNDIIIIKLIIITSVVVMLLTIIAEMLRRATCNDLCMSQLLRNH